MLDSYLSAQYLAKELPKLQRNLTIFMTAEMAAFVVSVPS